MIINNLKKADEATKIDQVIKNLFELLFKRYQIELETSMKDTDFIFDCVDLLYYKCHKTNLNCDGSCIDSSDWIKNNLN